MNLRRAPSVNKESRLSFLAIRSQPRHKWFLHGRLPSPSWIPQRRIRYASAYGAGLVAVGRYGEAMIPLNEAIKIAEAHPEVAYPTLAISTKIDALVGLRRYKEALQLANDCSKPPQRHSIRWAKDPGLLIPGHDRSKAWEPKRCDLRHAERRWVSANHMHNFRGLTDVGGTLAQTYFDNGQLHEALDAINAAIQANTNIPNELYLAPANLALKAMIFDKMGNSKAADALFSQEHHSRRLRCCSAHLRWVWSASFWPR